MTPEQEARFRFHLEFAEQSLLRKGSVTPQFVLHTGKRLIPIITPWPDAQARELSYELIKGMAIAENADAITFMGQGRAIRQDDHTKQREVVIVAYAWRDDRGKHMVESAPEIIRDKDGTPKGLLDRVIHEDAVGRLLDCLPDIDVPEEVQEVAKAAMDKLHQAIKPPTMH